MVKEFVHPRTRQRFTLRDDGQVEVLDPSGASGVFTRDGTWVSGELRHTDAVMCDFVGGTYLSQPPAP
ncbi:transposase [Mycolicibacterium sp. P9-22]|uniref:transposase n=1 Tax=Mycolicibacterium sp. P9-22 TaxID=2024613 RepID=UPI0011EE7ACB|nr:transposase [Mycolicibacterium sp. P9-22]KAA0120625.1 transposase [Mycolicibacterium sp. P9-22]